MNKSFEWFENNVIYRVPPNFPGAGRRVYPGFLQHSGFVAMNPDRHLSSHYDYFLDLVRGDDDSAESHRQFHYDAIGAGHYGIFSGRRWREKVYPQVRDFIASHQGGSTEPKALAPAGKSARKPVAAAKKAKR